MARAYVIGACDTKGAELAYIKALIEARGVAACLVDIGLLGGDGAGAGADVGPRQVAAFHPHGPSAVFGDDRGAAVAAMALALERFILSRDDVAGVIGAGGSGAAAMVTPAMRALPVGAPKVMVSTVASGDVAAYVGPADIAMMYSVTDIAGLNRISRVVLANAAHALAGMIAHAVAAPEDSRPAVGLTMFGVTTPCVAQVMRALEADYDCLAFHATGTGGRSMEKLADSGLVAGAIDATTTEICDLLMGGVLSAGDDRLGAFIRTGLPYVGSCGALDMVNFGRREAVPARYAGRRLHVHNPQVTLMRTNAEENTRIGAWIAERLNRMDGPVRFLLPEGGVSAIDKPGQPFHDPQADAALFAALKGAVRQTDDRRLVSLPRHINDPEFAQALVAAFTEIAG